MNRDEEIARYVERRGYKYKGDIIRKLSVKDFDNGCVRFNIPTINNIRKLINKDERHTTCNGEGCFVWLFPEDKEKYKDNNFYGELPGILVNSPIYDTYGLIWGIEIIIKCNGAKRPILSPKWVMNHI